MRDITRELAAAVNRNRGRTVAAGVEDLDLPEWTEQVPVADMEEDVAGRVGRQRRRRAVAELGNLGVVERGKGYFVQIK